MRRIFTENELQSIASDANGYAGDVAKQLLAERAEREKNPGVWDSAPEWADRCVARWEGSTKPEWTQYKEYIRTLPKTKAREIAERYNGLTYLNRQGVQCKITDIIEAAINEAMGGEK